MKHQENYFGGGMTNKGRPRNYINMVKMKTNISTYKAATKDFPITTPLHQNVTLNLSYSQLSSIKLNIDGGSVVVYVVSG